jgi:hypothetical protein
MSIILNIIYEQKSLLFSCRLSQVSLVIVLGKYRLSFAKHGIVTFLQGTTAESFETNKSAIIIETNALN